MADASFPTRTSVQLDPPKPISKWADHITLFPKSGMDRASLITTLDLFARVPDALGSRDRRIINERFNGQGKFCINDVMQSESGASLDLAVTLAPSGRGTTRITNLKLSSENELWGELLISEIDLLAEGMMLSDCIREFLRVVRPAPAEAIALLQGDELDPDIDIELVDIIAKGFSFSPNSLSYINAATKDPIVSGTLLTTSSAFYVRGHTNRIDIEGRPRIRYSRSYDPISRAFTVNYYPQSAIPTLVSDLGNYAFVSVLDRGRAVAIDGATNLQCDQDTPPYDTLSMMTAVGKLVALKEILQQDNTSA